MYNLNVDYLRPKKGEHLAAWHAEPFPLRETLAVWRGENGVILPVRKFPGDESLHGRGGAVDSAGNYIALSAYPGRVEGGYKPNESPPQSADMRVMFCGHYIKHWGHFLAEIVPRLWYALEHDGEIDRYVFIACPGEPLTLSGNYAEFFRLLGILDKVEIIDHPLACRELIVPELSFCLNTWYSREFLRLYDAVIRRADPPLLDAYPEKIYFTRTGLKLANDLDCGAEVMDDFFARNGYAVLSPEKLSLSETIHYVQSARAVASMSGTLPHNLLFGHQGQELIILERCVVNNDWQVSINRIRELKVTYIDANIPIYPVDTAGPFLIAFNEQMRHFAADRGMAPPDESSFGDAFLEQTFRRYMYTYNDLYRYHWHMEPRYMPLTPYMLEAYQAGRDTFGDYLLGRKPFRWHHYLELHYWKQLIKRLLKRV